MREFERAWQEFERELREFERERETRNIIAQKRIINQEKNMREIMQQRENAGRYFFLQPRFHVPSEEAVKNDLELAGF